MDYTKNRGIIIEKPEDADFVIGGANDVPFEIVNPTGEWTYPTREKQRFEKFDAYNCVSQSGTSSPEAQLIFQQTLPWFPQFIKLWLQSNGYIDENGLPNFSDRFSAKVSGTVPGRGVSIKKWWDAVRHFGLVPEKMWPSLTNFTEQEFYAEIPQEVLDKGQEFLKYFDITYTWMYGAGKPVPASSLPFKKHLQQAPIQTITATCPPWDGSIIPACPSQPTHATLVCKPPRE